MPTILRSSIIQYNTHPIKPSSERSFHQNLPGRGGTVCSANSASTSVCRKVVPLDLKFCGRNGLWIFPNQAYSTGLFTSFNQPWTHNRFYCFSPYVLASFREISLYGNGSSSSVKFCVKKSEKHMHPIITLKIIHSIIISCS